MRLLFLFTIFFLLSSQTHAQKQTGPLFSGAYLLELCKRDALGGEMVKGGHTACQAYIAGVIDYQDILISLGTKTSVDMCVPNTAKMNDLQDIVWVYLERNSQHDAFNAAPAVILALNNVFPCKR